MRRIYHLTTKAEWEQAQAAGEYRSASLATEGFIHASTVEQLAGSANRFFASEVVVVLLTIMPDRLEADLVWEHSPHSADPFPHIYGPLNLGAVEAAILWAKSSDGIFHRPANLADSDSPR